MRVPGFILPLLTLVSTIGEALAKNSDGGRKITADELGEIKDRAEGVLGAEISRPIAIGDDILVRIGGTDAEPVLRPGKVVRTWGEWSINAQVFLDGTNDTAALIKLGIEKPPVCIWWATSLSRGDGLAEWLRA
jgi:hypothetical protein